MLRRKDAGAGERADGVGVLDFERSSSALGDSTLMIGYPGTTDSRRSVPEPARTLRDRGRRIGAMGVVGRRRPSTHE